MIDKLKTFVLTFLVLFSLFQSYLLAYSLPAVEPIPQSDYVKTELLGSQSELEELLFPDQIILHLGNQMHSVLYPNSTPYTTILDNIKQRRFEGFRKTNLYQIGLIWDDVRNKQQGVEIRFRDGLQLNVLQKLLQIQGELPIENDNITRIWIFSKENKEDVRTFFFTDSPSVGYEVMKADFTVKDVQRFVTPSYTVFTSFHSTSGEYYLPNQPLPMYGYKFNYKQFSAEELKRSLFVDPAITRTLKERDGSQIYTDGKRGLQLNNEQHWMNYSDPVAPVESKYDVKENLSAGVQFINQHGGWNGTFAISKTPQRQSYSNQAFVFRQYYGSYPIINQRPDGFGVIKILMQKGVVSNYERSMILPEIKDMAKYEVVLPGGDDLDERLRKEIRRLNIASVFPAYHPIVTEQSVELKPVWALELKDGTYDFIE